MPFAFKRDERSAKVGRVQALLIRYRGEFNQVAEHLSDEEVRLQAGCVAAANKAEDHVSHFLHGTVFSMKECVHKHIAHARTSVSERSAIVVEIFSCLLKKIHDIVSGQSVQDNSLFEVSSFIPFRDVVLLPWIVATLDENPLAVRASDKTLPSSSSPSKTISRHRVSVLPGAQGIHNAGLVQQCEGIPRRYASYQSIKRLRVVLLQFFKD